MPGDVILGVQNAFVTQTGEVCPGLCAFSVTCCQEGFRVMVGFPVVIPSLLKMLSALS